MNGLIPKRSCVNPVLITTFGLEPPGTKKMRVKECRPWSEATESGFGKPFPNQAEPTMKVPMGTKRDEGEDPHLFLCPKPGSNRHVFLRTLDFESNASTNSAIRANGLRKNASNRLDFAKILQKAELSKCAKR